MYSRNITSIVLLANIFLIYSQTNYEIPISYCPNSYLPTIDVIIGEETEPNHLILNLNQPKSWIYKSNEQAEQKDLDTLKYDTFSVAGEAKKSHCYLTDKEKNKILKVDNFEYLDVPKLTGKELFVNGISVDKVIANAEAFKNNIKDLDYGFNIDFPANKLRIGKFEEITSLKKLEVLVHKWQLELSAIIFGDINSNDKKDNVYKVSESTKGLTVNRTILFETIYKPFYVPKDFFDYIEDNNYFFYEKEQICERKIEKGDIVYLCDKKNKDKIRDIHLVLNEKYILTLKKDYLLDCQENSNVCKFNMIFLPRERHFILGADILKHLNIYFMQNEKSIYFKDIDMPECDLSEAKFHVLGRK